MTDADTMINGLTYSQIFTSGDQYEGAIRDADGRVMIVPPSYNEEFLLYDFSLPAGTDTVLEVWMGNDWIYEMYMQFLGPVGPDGRNVVQAQGGQWIEGIGSDFGLLEQPLLSISGMSYNLDCMSHNGMILYPEAGPGVCDLTTTIAGKNTIPFQLYPNPATDLLQVRTTLDFGPYSILSNDGRIVQQGELGRGSQHIPVGRLPAGIYALVIEASGEQLRASFIKE